MNLKLKIEFINRINATKELLNKLKIDPIIEVELLDLLIDAIECFQGRIVLDYCPTDDNIKSLQILVGLNKNKEPKND